jgi:F-type H+-transporting ATPase subunit b
MVVFALRGGVVLADDQPTATEPVTGSIDHEPSQTGTAAGEPEGQATHHEGHGQHGEHGEHGGIDAKTFALQLLNFGALLFILIYFGGRAFSKALRNRHNQLKAEIDSAAKLKALAQQRFQEQESRLANLEQELAGLRATVAQEGEREKARLLQAAEEKAKRIQDETRFQLDQQVKEAELRLRAEVASTAMKVADEVLRRSVNAEDELRLTKDFVAGAGEVR